MLGAFKHSFKQILGLRAEAELLQDVGHIGLPSEQQVIPDPEVSPVLKAVLTGLPPVDVLHSLPFHHSRLTDLILSLPSKNRASWNERPIKSAKASDLGQAPIFRGASGVRQCLL